MNSYKASEQVAVFVFACLRLCHTNALFRIRPSQKYLCSEADRVVEWGPFKTKPKFIPSSHL